uniref:Myb-like domain-containing protein n=1 Tax=Brassica oleracea var. oleracea TaxID=109376 RepID=A0A0D3DPM5_BRAOL
MKAVMENGLSYCHHKEVKEKRSDRLEEKSYWTRVVLSTIMHPFLSLETQVSSDSLSTTPPNPISLEETDLPSTKPRRLRDQSTVISPCLSRFRRHLRDQSLMKADEKPPSLSRRLTATKNHFKPLSRLELSSSKSKKDGRSKRRRFVKQDDYNEALLILVCDTALSLSPELFFFLVCLSVELHGSRWMRKNQQSRGLHLVEQYNQQSVSSTQVPFLATEGIKDLHFAEASRSKERRTWTPTDDVVLINSWLNTRKDAVIGNEQRSHAFWTRIDAYYNASPKVGRRSMTSFGLSKMKLLDSLMAVKRERHLTARIVGRRSMTSFASSAVHMKQLPDRKRVGKMRMMSSS